MFWLVTALVIVLLIVASAYVDRWIHSKHLEMGIKDDPWCPICNRW